MHDGTDSDLARESTNCVFAAFRTVRPDSVMSNGFYDDSVRQLNNALDVLLDLTYPFSGDVSLEPDDLKSGVLEQFFDGTR